MTSRFSGGFAASLALPLLGLALAGCNRTAGTPPAGAAPAAVQLPSGGGCSGEIAQFQAVLKSDADTGNVARSVYSRAEPELNRASAACAAGREGEARSILASTKGRFGYR